tara:strand:+ start:559 stop:1077 length:519 start_codon:yes stop_codon:yes gene_type:complete
MSTLKPVTVFDLCPDIEWLIENELKVLLKFREAVKEFKLRMKLNSKGIHQASLGVLGSPAYRNWFTSTNQRRHTRHPDPFNHLIHILFPYSGIQRWDAANVDCWHVQMLDFHGINFESRSRNHWTNHSLDLNTKNRFECETHDSLNEVLTRLGYKRFKSKKKADKIKMIMNH